MTGIIITIIHHSKTAPSYIITLWQAAIYEGHYQLIFIMNITIIIININIIITIVKKILQAATYEGDCQLYECSTDPEGTETDA